MRAAVCREHGPPEVVRIEEMPAPPLQPGSVRVRIGAAAVNFPDVLIVANRYQISVPPPFVAADACPETAVDLWHAKHSPKAT